MYPFNEIGPDEGHSVDGDMYRDVFVPVSSLLANPLLDHGICL